MKREIIITFFFKINEFVLKGKFQIAGTNTYEFTATETAFTRPSSFQTNSLNKKGRIAQTLTTC